MKYGFVKVAAAIPQVRVANPEYNCGEILRLTLEASDKGAEIIVFPELSVTGYTCQDLFRQQTLLQGAESGVASLLEGTCQTDIIAIVGVPVAVGPLLLNCALVMQHGAILGIVPKTYLPNYSEFYEKRWFASASDLQAETIRYAGQEVLMSPQLHLFTTAYGVKFGIELCEDVWAPLPPSNRLTLAGADIIFNLSASDELIGKHNYLLSLLAQQSARTICGYVYSGCGFGESTQDVVYGGNALIYENGQLLASSARFSLKEQLVMQQIDVERLRAERRNNSTYAAVQRLMAADASHYLHIAAPHRMDEADSWRLIRKVNPHPFIPTQGDMQQSCEEIFNIQVCGLAKRLVHTHCKTVVLGISGGLDSTLALLVCVRTFDRLGLDRKGIVGVTMPGFGTTGRTYHNAVGLIKSLGVTLREISIAAAVTQHFQDIGHDGKTYDVTYENSQARERTQILMDLSNQLGGLVIGTGDLSELALGWCTYNGDHMSMYGVNVSIPKTLIRHLVRYVAETEPTQAADGTRTAREILLDIIDTPISPELTPADSKGNIKQKTEDLVGPYELHDFFLYYILRFGFSPDKLLMLAKCAFQGDDNQVAGRGSYDDATILHWLRTFFRRFFSQQFKRSCLPDGPKVGSVSLSPRGDWRMPSDADAALWLKKVDYLS